MAHILIVDDEESFAEMMAEYLELLGHSVVVAGSVKGAREALGRKTPELVLLDLMLPDGSGLELMDRFEKTNPQKILIITGHSGVKSLIGGMDGERIRFMKKPIEPRDLAGILNTLDNAGPGSGEVLQQDKHFGLMVGESEAMQRIYRMIRKVAPTDSTIFIQGESGTGKELVAEAIHKTSEQKGRFVPVNCGGLAKDLISSQLFGHERGSFTGANRKHAGYFEQADQGTLFLDEITEMPLEMQTHLLRVLETRKILRLGSEVERDVSARLVAATNCDPAESVSEGKLREDLYFRLQVFPITLPPLRQRPGDIRLLANHFLAELNQQHSAGKQFTPEAIRQFENHAWPGNIRELKHTVHRAFILAESDAIEAPQRFDEDLPGGIEGVSVGRSIADVERDLIITTVEHFEGDKKAAAATLGVSVKTLYNRLKAYQEASG